VKQLTAC